MQMSKELLIIKLQAASILSLWGAYMFVVIFAFTPLWFVGMGLTFIATCLVLSEKDKDIGFILSGVLISMYALLSFGMSII